MNREFLMLAANYADNQNMLIGGWFASEKLDGMRAFWDGGITRGMLASQVPWANTLKDGRLKTPPVATGLWSRYGKVIHAPDWWLDLLPPATLDGELWCGRGQYQLLRDIAGHHSGDAGWKEVKYMAFDMPCIDLVLQDGRINNPNFQKELKGCDQWVRELKTFPLIMCRAESFFKTRYEKMVRSYTWNDTCQLHYQEELPARGVDAIARLTALSEEIAQKKGEGLIIRDPNSLWVPKRIKQCLKVKPLFDDEATVLGYIWGRETNKGSKLLGMMGAMVVEWKGKKFELSGFTDAERQMKSEVATEDCYFSEVAGLLATKNWNNPLFPRGSKVTFKYRELTDIGIPKEARYFRKHVQE